MRHFFFALIVFIWACSPKEDRSFYDFGPTPAGEVPQPEYNKATSAGVELGKKLFFDPYLSSNNKVSCATCHDPGRAFSDGQALSFSGVTGNVLTRHSPALFNLAWYEGFFWDGGSKNLESQVFGPLTHPDEMGVELFALIEKLNRHPEYPALFKKVWGSDTITSQTLARSLAQYERTLLSFNGRYDQWKDGKEELSATEREGMEVYEQFCASCHSGALFTDLSYHNNGLDTAFTDRSHELLYFGRYRISNDSTDIGRYKTPSLRNLAFTGPYMHDGRFADLDAVLAHYFREHQGNERADNLLKNPEYARVDEKQKKALKAFLYTLSDSAFVLRH